MKEVKFFKFSYFILHNAFMYMQTTQQLQIQKKSVFAFYIL